MYARDKQPSLDDEGGLHAPPELTGWRKAWWWFDFIILVKLARLRFIAILALIGVVITQWEWLLANYDKWTRPAASATAAAVDIEFFCPMHPTIVRSEPGQKCPICFMPLSKRKRGSSTAEPLPAGIVSRVQLSPYRVVLAGVQTFRIDYQPLTKQVTAVGTIEFNERGPSKVGSNNCGSTSLGKWSLRAMSSLSYTAPIWTSRSAICWTHSAKTTENCSPRPAFD